MYGELHFDDVTQIVEAGQKLQGTGFDLNDEWIGSIMLAGLSEKYMPMMMANEHSGMVITTDAIKGKLMDMEPEDSDANSVFACFRKNHSFINQPKNLKSVQSMAKKDGGNAQLSISIKGKQNVKCYIANSMATTAISVLLNATRIQKINCQKRVMHLVPCFLTEYLTRMIGMSTPALVRI
ncbi:unnamed protein product [Hermetia illucens]|uniref:Uncharacterized protein n=1 Tax=Hermetia illucens TaxID=343691 RepID=A0A7R8UWB5_HERIL|nr:unnamed protein product [Hermetia illucens]